MDVAVLTMTLRAGNVKDHPYRRKSDQGLMNKGTEVSSGAAISAKGNVLILQPAKGGGTICPNFIQPE